MRALPVLLVAALVAGCGGAAATEVDGVHDLLADEAERGFSGVVLVRYHGRILVERGYGVADRERDIPVRPDSAFEFASITKLFTAATVMKLAEEGKLSLDDRLTSFFRHVPADKRAVTLRQLLAHRSGLPLYTGFGELEPVSRERVLAAILGAPLEFEPGRQVGYSNAGYTLLAAVVEHVSGERFEDAVRSRVFVPAGMTRTGFFGDALWSPGQAAKGYGGDFLSEPGASVSWSVKGAGGAVGTAGDLARWVDAVRRGAVVRRDSVPVLYRLTIGPPPPGMRFYAYAGGNSRGFNATVEELPDEPALVIVLSNASPPDAGRAEKVARRLVRALVDGPD